MGIAGCWKVGRIFYKIAAISEERVNVVVTMLVQCTCRRHFLGHKVAKLA